MANTSWRFRSHCRRMVDSTALMPYIGDSSVLFRFRFQLSSTFRMCLLLVSSYCSTVRRPIRTTIQGKSVISAKLHEHSGPFACKRFSESCGLQFDQLQSAPCITSPDKTSPRYSVTQRPVPAQFLLPKTISTSDITSSDISSPIYNVANPRRL